MDCEDFDCEDFDCEDFDCEDFDLIQTTTCAHCTGTNFDKFCETCKISYLSDRCRSPTRSLLALNNTLQITKCTKCEKEVLLTSDFMGLCNNCLAIQKPVNPFIGVLLQWPQDHRQRLPHGEHWIDHADDRPHDPRYPRHPRHSL